MWLAKILVPGAKVFQLAKEGDGGFDIWVTHWVNADKNLIPTHRTLMPGEDCLFMTGIATAFPVTHVGLVCDRSGYGVRGLMKQAGVVDSNWRGEWGVKLYNASKAPIRIESVLDESNAKAACQVVFVECWTGKFMVVDKLPESVRGDSWRGSSDQKG